jgi:hypothetical protein
MAQFTIRIPDELRDRIVSAADADKRSMNGEIEWLLEGALAERAKRGTSGDGGSHA